MTLILIIVKFLTIVFGSIIAGFIGSLTGLGGGTVLVPVLTLFYGIPFIFAAMYFPQLTFPIRTRLPWTVML